MLDLHLEVWKFKNYDSSTWHGVSIALRQWYRFIHVIFMHFLIRVSWTSDACSATWLFFIFRTDDRFAFAHTGRWLSCAQPRQCPKILTLYQRKKEVCSVRSRGSPWQRSRHASPRNRPSLGSSRRRERKARYGRDRVHSMHIDNFSSRINYIIDNHTVSLICVL